MCPGYLSIPSNHAQELSWKMLCVLQKAYNLTGILNSLDHPHCTVFIYVCFCDIDSYKLYSFIKRLMTIENNIPLVNIAHAQTSYPKDP